MKVPRSGLVLILAAAAWTGAAAKVGILISKGSAMMTAAVTGVKSVVGSDVVELDMDGVDATGKQHCATMKSQGCNVVVAVGKGALDVAAGAMGGTPVVFCMIMGGEESGAKGANVTGVSLDIPMVKQFEAFKSVVPSLKKVGLVYSADIGALAEEMKSAAKKTGLTLVEKVVAGEKDVPNAIRALKGQIDGLYLPPDRTVAQHDAFQFIALFTFENNVPFMAPTSRFVKKGALVALMIDYEDVGKQTGQLVKKVAAGASPSSLPVEPPEATMLVLNQKTAETIGINIPPSLSSSSMIIK